MDNKALKQTYDKMHEQGPDAWFGDGKEEAEVILDLGGDWYKNNILEIGCGEGELAYAISQKSPACIVWAIDYSETAVLKAVERFKDADRIHFGIKDYRDLTDGIRYDRIVMMGVLEHLDDPFKELKWMIDNLLVEHGDVITSSPAFLNPRGFIWMTLNMLGAVMSKTDLHYLNVWDFKAFCEKHKYQLTANRSADQDWGGGQRMIDDYQKRLPLALKDGNITYKKRDFDKFMKWLAKVVEYTESAKMPGATTVYRIQT